MQHRDTKARSQAGPAGQQHGSVEEYLLATMASTISLAETTARIQRETAQALRTLAARSDDDTIVRRIRSEDAIEQLSRVEDAIAALTAIPGSHQPQPGLPGREPRAGRRNADPAAEPLTAREEAVLRLLRGPLPLHEIGRELDVSINTIKSHTRAIYRKLGAAGRRNAIQHARQLGILLPRNRHSPADGMLRLRPPRQPDPTPRLRSGRSRRLGWLSHTGAGQAVSLISSLVYVRVLVCTCTCVHRRPLPRFEQGR
jgi:DNA-binding NarL/FixJ family response regulator